MNSTHGRVECPMVYSGRTKTVGRSPHVSTRAALFSEMRLEQRRHDFTERPAHRRVGTGSRARRRRSRNSGSAASTLLASPPWPSLPRSSPCSAKAAQGLRGHRVDGVGHRQGLDVQGVWRSGILGPGTGPEQALGACAGIGERAPARRRKQLAIGAVGARRDRDPEPVAEVGRRIVTNRLVQAADEQRATEAPACRAAVMRLRCARIASAPAVLFPREQQLTLIVRRRNRLLDARDAFRGSWNLAKRSPSPAP